MISDLMLASYRSCRENDNSYQVPVNIGFRLFMIIWGIEERESVGVQKICMNAAVQGKLSTVASCINLQGIFMGHGADV